MQQKDPLQSSLLGQMIERAYNKCCMVDVKLLFIAEIVPLETELNERVYALFDLTPAEIKIVETSAKYQYGEV